MKRWHLIALAAAVGLFVWYRLKGEASADGAGDAAVEGDAATGLPSIGSSLAGGGGAGTGLAIPDPSSNTTATPAPSPAPAPAPAPSGPSSVDKLKERQAAQRLAILDAQAAQKADRQAAVQRQKDKQAAARLAEQQREETARQARLAKIQERRDALAIAGPGTGIYTA